MNIGSEAKPHIDAIHLLVEKRCVTNDATEVKKSDLIGTEKNVHKKNDSLSLKFNKQFFQIKLEVQILIV